MGAQKIWKEKRVDNGQCKHGAMTSFQVSGLPSFFFRYSDIAQKVSLSAASGIGLSFLLFFSRMNDQMIAGVDRQFLLLPPPSLKNPFISV